MPFLTRRYQRCKSPSPDIPASESCSGATAEHGDQRHPAADTPPEMRMPLARGARAAAQVEGGAAQAAAQAASPLLTTPVEVCLGAKFGGRRQIACIKETADEPADHPYMINSVLSDSSP